MNNQKRNLNTKVSSVKLSFLSSTIVSGGKKHLPLKYSNLLGIGKAIVDTNIVSSLKKTIDCPENRDFQIAQLASLDNTLKTNYVKRSLENQRFVEIAEEFMQSAPEDELEKMSLVTEKMEVYLKNNEITNIHVLLAILGSMNIIFLRLPENGQNSLFYALQDGAISYLQKYSDELNFIINKSQLSSIQFLEMITNDKSLSLKFKKEILQLDKENIAALRKLAKQKQQAIPLIEEQNREREHQLQQLEEMTHQRLKTKDKDIEMTNDVFHLAGEQKENLLNEVIEIKEMIDDLAILQQANLSISIEVAKLIKQELTPLNEKVKKIKQRIKQDPVLQENIAKKELEKIDTYCASALTWLKSNSSKDIVKAFLVISDLFYFLNFHKNGDLFFSEVLEIEKTVKKISKQIKDLLNNIQSGLNVFINALFLTVNASVSNIIQKLNKKLLSTEKGLKKYLREKLYDTNNHLVPLFFDEYIYPVLQNNLTADTYLHIKKLRYTTLLEHVFNDVFTSVTSKVVSPLKQEIANLFMATKAAEEKELFSIAQRSQKERDGLTLEKTNASLNDFLVLSMLQELATQNKQEQELIRKKYKKQFEEYKTTLQNENMGKKDSKKAKKIQKIKNEIEMKVQLNPQNRELEGIETQIRNRKKLIKEKESPFNKKINKVKEKEEIEKREIEKKYNKQRAKDSLKIIELTKRAASEEARYKDNVDLLKKSLKTLDKKEFNKIVKDLRVIRGLKNALGKFENISATNLTEIYEKHEDNLQSLFDAINELSQLLYDKSLFGYFEKSAIYEDIEVLLKELHELFTSFWPEQTIELEKDIKQIITSVNLDEEKEAQIKAVKPLLDMLFDQLPILDSSISLSHKNELEQYFARFHALYGEVEIQQNSKNNFVVVADTPATTVSELVEDGFVTNRLRVSFSQLELNLKKYKPSASEKNKQYIDRFVVFKENNILKTKVLRETLQKKDEPEVLNYNIFAMPENYDVFAKTKRTGFVPIYGSFISEYNTLYELISKIKKKELKIIRKNFLKYTYLIQINDLSEKEVQQRAHDIIKVHRNKLKLYGLFLLDELQNISETIKRKPGQIVTIQK